MGLRHYYQRLKLRWRRDGPLSVPISIFRLGCRSTGLFPFLLEIRQHFDQWRYGCESTAPPLNTLSVDPREIEYYLLYPPQYRDVYRWFGRIKSGEWDQNADPIERSKKFQGVIQRYEEGHEWNETMVFDHMRELVEAGKYPDSCQSIQDVKERYAEIDELYHNIKTSGYKSGEDLPSKRGEITDISLAIGRNGELILQGDGIHRVAIARVLDIDEIPAKISMRHLQWQRTRDAIARGERELNHLADHPDLQNFASTHSS